jgi:putative heme iron utilization protein
MDLVSGDDVRRVWFETPLTSAKDMHMTLVRMAGEARRALGRPANHSSTAAS